MTITPALSMHWSSPFAPADFDPTNQLPRFNMPLELGIFMGAKRLVRLYERFKTDAPALAASLGFDPDAIPYSDFDTMVDGWLLDAGKTKNSFSIH